MNPNTGKSQEISIVSRNLFSRMARGFLQKEKTAVISEQQVNETNELIENIRKAKNEWTNANMNFEFADEQELVDFYTYKIKACEIQYEYLLKKAKEKGIRTELIDNAGITAGIDTR